MDFNQLLGNINWIAVVLVTLLSFVLGMLWHTPLLFGKPWAEENKATLANRKINALLIFGGTGLMHLFASLALSACLSGIGALEGMLSGFFIGIFFVLPAFSGTYLFASRRLRLLAIDAGLYIVFFTCAGLIFGAW